MDKIDMLFIRACKSFEPQTRVASVYKRFYYSEYNPKALTIIFINLIKRNNIPIELMKFIEELDPNRYYFLEIKDDRTYYERCLDVIINHIRLINVNDLEGFIPPLKFKD